MSSPVEADPELLAILRARLGLDQLSLGAGPDQPVPADTGVLASAEYIYHRAIDVALDMPAIHAAADRVWALVAAREAGRAGAGADPNTSTAHPPEDAALAAVFDAWTAHPLHPDPRALGPGPTLALIFAIDTLNFSFWSAAAPATGAGRFGQPGRPGPFAVDYRARRYTGYWALVAALRRGLDEGYPVTSPAWWAAAEEDPDPADPVADPAAAAGDPASAPLTPSLLAHIFRSATAEPIPLLRARFECLRAAGRALARDHAGELSALIAAADHSAGRLANLLARMGSCFADEAGWAAWPDRPAPASSDIDADDDDNDVPVPPLPLFCADDGQPAPRARAAAAAAGTRTVRFLKRAQIFVADVWAAFRGGRVYEWGRFDDIGRLTIFADYRVPQVLAALGCIRYSAPLVRRLTSASGAGAGADAGNIPSGSRWELEIRGCAIWAAHKLVERVRQKYAPHPRAAAFSAVLLDFLLYDTAKAIEAEAARSGDADADADTGDAAEDDGCGGTLPADTAEAEKVAREVAPVMMAHHRTRSIWY